MSSIEVRQCSVCQQAAAVMVRNWESSVSFYGLLNHDTGKIYQRDFVCQHCSASFRIEPIKLRFFLGLLLSPLVFLMGFGILGTGVLSGDIGFGAAISSIFLISGGILLWWGFRPWWVHRCHPVVDATPPEVRFLLTEPLRRCRCGAAISCQKVVENRTNGIYTGTEWQYSCPHCQHFFKISSPWELIMLCFGVLFLMRLANFLWPTASDQGWGCPLSLLVLGGGCLLLVSWNALNPWRYPIVFLDKVGQNSESN